MPQQEMSFEGSHYEQSPEYPQHYSGQYGQSQFAQKLPRRTLSKQTAMRIQLWTAYASLLVAMVLSFLLGGRDWTTPIDFIGSEAGSLLFTCYIIIIALNILVFVLVNFKVKVTRKLMQ